MSDGSILALVLALLFALFLMRVPVAFALFTSGALGLLAMRDSEFMTRTVARLLYESSSAYVLVVLVFYITMGVFAMRGTFGEDAFRLAQRALRKVPGGLGLATIVTSAVFAAVSGSSLASATSFGPTAVREMRRHGYASSVAAGIVAGGGTLGILIPPSIILVMYGIVSGESIGALLIGALIPGAMTIFAYLALVLIRSVSQPDLMGRQHHADSSEPYTRTSSFNISVSRGPLGGAYAVIRVVTLFGIVVGGVYFGLATVTESAALAAGVALLFLLIDVVRAKGSLLARLREVWMALVEGARLTSMSFALIIGASVFTFFLIAANVPSTISTWAIGLPIPDLLLLLIVLSLFFVMGMFLDTISMVLIAVPLTYPIVTSMGFSGIWFGIVVVKMAEIGLITPPFGMNVFVVSGTSGVSVAQTFRGVLWFVPVELAIVGLLIAFPELVTWLPERMAAG